MAEPVSLHVNDYGTAFRLTIKDQDDNVVNLSSGSGTITFYKPDKTTFTRSLTMPNGGSDGLVSYTTQSGEMNQVGIWSLSAYIMIPSGNYSTNVPEFRVLANLS